MNLRSKLEVLSNIGTLIATILLSTVLVKVYLIPPPAPASVGALPAAAVGSGMKTRIPGVD